MSNLTDKQLSIVEGLNKAFPDGEVTRSELMEWAQRCGLSKYAPSFVWKNENKVIRGVFRIPSITEENAVAALATHSSAVMETETEKNPEISNVI